MLEWFMKDHVILKTGVTVAENSAFASQEYIKFLNILKSKTDILNFNNIE